MKVARCRRALLMILALEKINILIILIIVTWKWNDIKLRI